MEFIISKAGREHGQEFARLIQQVWEAMEQKEWFVADSPSFIEESMISGRARGYWAKEIQTGRTAGVFLAVIPGPGSENLGKEGGLSREERKLAVHMDTVGVLPWFRGLGLQRRLMEQAEKDLKKEGFRYFLCTVHPDNRFSRENMEKLGYRQVWVGEKYGGYMRAVMMKRSE